MEFKNQSYPQKKNKLHQHSAFCSVKQLRTDFTIKDPIVLKAINPFLDDYRTKITDLKLKLNQYDVNNLINFLTDQGIKSAEEINIIEFDWNKLAFKSLERGTD
ncbi:hypothetical protein [Mucilaginibacter sp.]|uniref:hypothetical protein n=1 Tax=Mucilaginibacter sp. TaxID=1882438 RepID=UPI002625E5C2|nr:hypothetical protein [Mucilaginibacter sp.]MDB4920751.1 recombinase [Mucilaginibacter sp.]